MIRNKPELAAPRKPRVVIFDLECSNLKAPFGFTFCMGYQELNDAKPSMVSLLDFPREIKKDPTNDKVLMREAVNILTQADYLVTWYGRYFDERFLRSRLLYHDLGTLPPIINIDGWFTSRYELAMHSNRLEAVQEFLQLKNKKTSIDYTAWRRGMAGHAPSIKKIIHHCIQDVKVLKEVYLKFRPYVKGHPNMTVLTGQTNVCKVCLSPKIHRRGVTVTKEAAFQRFQCQKCGSWSKGSKVVHAKG